MTNQIIKDLQKARALIKKGWCQGWYATKENGSRVNSLHPDATNFCLSGACTKVVQDGQRPVTRKIDINHYLGRVLNRRRYNSQISVWNDEPGRTKRQVLGLIDSAIRLAEKEAA